MARTLTLRVHLSPVSRVDVRTAADYTISAGALYVWGNRDENELVARNALMTFAPGAWESAEWLN